MKLLTVTAYAATHEAKRQAAQKWKEKGALVFSGEMVDVQASDRLMKSLALARFSERTRPHGGRRVAGKRRIRDGDTGTAAQTAPAAVPAWTGWHRLSNPNSLSDDMRKLIGLGDDVAIEEMLDTLDFGEWENACTAVGWDRWPDGIADRVAASLGIVDVKKVRQVLHAEVRARLAAIEIGEADLADPRLEPR